MAQNVLFKTGTRAQYNAIETKSEVTLYWLTDTQELYKGDVLFGTGALATDKVAGLLSPTDKAKLDAFVSGGVSGLSPVDGTIVLTDTDDGGKAIGVAIAPDAENALQAVEGGLFVPTVEVPEYAIAKLETTEDGYAVSYQLKKIVGEEVSYVGEVINIAKDLVLKSATLETVDEADIPYEGAVIGDPYIHMVFNDATASDIYVPVNGLVDTYTAGDGIKIENNVVSVKIDVNNANGLVAVEGGLSLNLATADSAGAMSAADKTSLDALVALDIVNKYATKEELQAISDKVAASEESFVWGEM